MPKVKWSEINEVIHQCKNTLQLAYGIEMMCKKMRLTLSEQLDSINDIILRQIDEGGESWEGRRGGDIQDETI